MPTAITHQLLAEEIYQTLPKKLQNKITSLAHYYLGAQGCDIAFLYTPLDGKRNNLGRVLHAQKPLLFFKILYERAQRDNDVLSYALGYITHYALDTVFHPFIYEQMGKKGGTLLHHAIEHAYDGEFLRERGGKLSAYALPRDKNINLQGVYNVYARYAREMRWGEVTQKELQKAVKRYYFLSGWRLPLYRKRLAKEGESLKKEAIKRGKRLISRFLRAKSGEFSAEEFGLHFLSGEIAEK